MLTGSLEPSVLGCQLGFRDEPSLIKRIETEKSTKVVRSRLTTSAAASQSLKTGIKTTTRICLPSSSEFKPFIFLQSEFTYDFTNDTLDRDNRAALARQFGVVVWTANSPPPVNGFNDFLHRLYTNLVPGL